MLRAAMVTALWASVAAVALAGGEAVNTDRTGLAIQGYDPVAYFTTGTPTPGSYQITADHDGATYRFANEANKAQFLKDPAAFVPQCGGYCAFGVAIGKKFPADPKVFKIVDKKLYLNLSSDIGEKFNADLKGNIDKANANWPKIKDTPANQIK